MNKNFYTLLKITIILFILSKGMFLLAVPAYPGKIEYKQPDGSIIELFMHGDEKINWAETPDGYTILVTREGEYQYAIHDDTGNLVFSGVAVSKAEKRSGAEVELLHNLPKKLFFSPEQTEMMQAVWEMKADFDNKSFPTTGERKLICILMQTPDVPFTRTQEEFDALLNQLNYTLDGATGSLRDYYLENSWGQFDLTVDVVGPYTASQNMANYGSFEGARALITEGVHMADSLVDYSLYDNSGDGNVDGIYMIFAGHGQEAGGGANTIWSHAWSISPVQLDGVWIYRYACSPELRGNAQSNPSANMTRIGVIGHEFGHVLGAPDYYDTDGEGSGGSFPGTGQWDMMAGGTWNNGGATPAHHNAYTKTHVYNWAEQILLDSLQQVTMFNIVENSDSYYRIDTYTPGEYFLLENRKKIGFDQLIPGEGLIIYHVHSGIAQVGNGVNAGHPQRMYPVYAPAQSDPNSFPASYGNINSAFAPFPGQANITSFYDLSPRSSKAWSGVYNNRPISNITRNANEGTVSFDFLDENYMTQWLEWDDGHSINSIGVHSGGKFQIAQRFLPEDLFFLQAYGISAIKVYVNQNATTAKVKIWQGVDKDNLIEYISKGFTQIPQKWNVVHLDQTFLVNPNLELWIGAEFDDPGAGVFPAGRDVNTDYDGKGNMIRIAIEDPTAWVPLSEYNYNGDFSIKAMIDTLAEEAQFVDIVLTANPPEGGLISGHGSYALNTDHTVVASPDQEYKFLNWTENGIEVSMDPNYSFAVERGRILQANFQITTSVNLEPGMENLISVFPNPVKNLLWIEFPEQYNIELIEMTNDIGQVVWSEKFSEGKRSQYQIDVSNMARGVYVIRFSNGENDVFQKVLID